jgi:hypothetical protein
MYHARGEEELENIITVVKLRRIKWTGRRRDDECIQGFGRQT